MVALQTAILQTFRTAIQQFCVANITSIDFAKILQINLHVIANKIASMRNEKNFTRNQLAKTQYAIE